MEARVIRMMEAREPKVRQMQGSATWCSTSFALAQPVAVLPGVFMPETGNQPRIEQKNTMNRM